MCVLPDNLREKLREPLGLLVDEDELLKLLSKERYVVSVGDQVTFTLLKHGVVPIFCVVDFKIKRGVVSSVVRDELRSFGRKVVVVDNPSGCISDDLWGAIEDAYKVLEKGSIRIEVVGEEDLAALPAIFLAPGDVTIIYGLPNKGVVFVKSSDENKRKVKEILDEM